ncbi:MAG: hypothetical protein MUP36_03270 [Demequinaceae bacterium]|nr:hypothetical protein [Demequinaceae bacterium]
MATVNMNEQMNQLGQIGSVGYTPTDVVVDQLVGRAKRARAIRQGSAALVGSIGAVGLGLIGAQVFVNLTQNDDPATIADRNFEFNSAEWGDRSGEDYTGLGKTQDELAKAWDDLKAAAAVKVETPAPKTEEPAPVKPKKPASEIPDGSFLFGNGQVYKCEQWVDTATGTTFWGAWSGTGSWGYKMIQCDPNDKYESSYKYVGSSATISGHTCTGATTEYKGATHRISCRTNGVLVGLYGEWNGSPDGSRWTLNNGDGKVLVSPATYKWFVSGTCDSTLYSNSTPLFGFPQCSEVACNGWYYTTDQHPTKDGHRYSWNGSAWVIDDPAPEPTETTEPEPDPDPIETTPPPDPDPVLTPDPES